LKIKVITSVKSIIEHFKHFEDVIKENCNSFEIEYDSDESKYLIYDKNYNKTYKQKIGQIMKDLFKDDTERVNT